jgi:DNA repair protein RecN (Recombination protein N)
MLAELSIENLGVIKSLSLQFSDGFTAFTGETGAGKTMLVEAISLIVGGRADSSVVRTGEDEARVEARFVGTGDENDETILTRVVSREGRSRAYINGRMATVAQLSEIGEHLVDIHGQHAHQRLLSAATQRDALDQHAKVDLGPLNSARARVTEIDAALAALGGDEKSRAREIDLLAFQCAEIEGAGLSSVAEEAQLAQEEDQLSDATRYQEALWAAVETFSGDDGVLDTISSASRHMGQISALHDLIERLAALQGEASDVAALLRERAEGIEEDPERLEYVRQRRQLLKDLMRKYGDTLADVISFGNEARERLDEISSYAERVAQLEASRMEALEALHQAQLVVGNTRRSAAPTLGKAVEARLKELPMPHAQVAGSVGDQASDPAGESVVFMLAANPGSAPAPLTKVASGGELARTMLALRLVLTSEPGTMVFDEVDAGIGGSAAVAVASALRELGNGHQIFAVTHLPQVAAAAHHQITVSKTVEKGHTFGAAVHVSGGDRTVEIARMLSGGVADKSATAHATELLESFATAHTSPKGARKRTK